MNQNLKNLIKREGNKVISVKIKDVKECISKVKDMSVFNHLMFGAFEELLQFDGMEKSLKLLNLVKD
jgi:hypothetical protein